MVHFVNIENNISCLFRRRQPNTNDYYFYFYLFENSIMSINNVNIKILRVNHQEKNCILHLLQNITINVWSSNHATICFLLIDIKCKIFTALTKRFARLQQIFSRTQKCICNRKLAMYSIDQFINSTFALKVNKECICKMKISPEHSSYKKYFAQYENGYLFFLSYIEQECSKYITNDTNWPYG